MIYISSETDLILIDKIQAIYFYVPWMPYHKKMQSMINKMETKYNKIDFFAVDVDYFKSFIKRFNINSVPTILILNNGKEIKKINGLVLTSAINRAFADICKV